VVEPHDIVKGYQVDKNVYVQVEDEELEDLQIESSHTIEIDKFVPRDQIDATYFDSPYYIVPNDNVGQDAFARSSATPWAVSSSPSASGPSSSKRMAKAPAVSTCCASTRPCCRAL
jgi:hypothetical protein